MGYVSSTERDGKKVYTITDAGKGFLSEREEVINRIKGHMKDWWSPQSHEEFRETMHELSHLGRLVGRRLHHIDPEKWARIREVVSRACRDIEGIVET
jgi:DNA-binding PadR family transcriptional regulator